MAANGSIPSPLKNMKNFCETETLFKGSQDM